MRHGIKRRRPLILRPAGRSVIGRAIAANFAKSRMEREDTKGCKTRKRFFEILFKAEKYAPLDRPFLTRFGNANFPEREEQRPLRRGFRIDGEAANEHTLAL
ncbi:MAG TPA: hypothetical protein VGO59_01100 [Verrucomicrobiae bacterium]|jgi:hypothetical protein